MPPIETGLPYRGKIHVSENLLPEIQDSDAIADHNAIDVELGDVSQEAKDKVVEVLLAGAEDLSQLVSTDANERAVRNMRLRQERNKVRMTIKEDVNTALYGPKTEQSDVLVQDVLKENNFVCLELGDKKIYFTEEEQTRWLSGRRTVKYGGHTYVFDENGAPILFELHKSVEGVRQLDEYNEYESGNVAVKLSGQYYVFDKDGERESFVIEDDFFRDNLQYKEYPSYDSAPFYDEFEDGNRVVRLIMTDYSKKTPTARPVQYMFDAEGGMVELDLGGEKHKNVEYINSSFGGSIVHEAHSQYWLEGTSSVGFKISKKRRFRSDKEMVVHKFDEIKQFKNGRKDGKYKGGWYTNLEKAE